MSWLMIFGFLDRPLELPEFEILPNKSQVVFEGWIVSFRICFDNKI